MHAPLPSGYAHKCVDWFESNREFLLNIALGGATMTHIVVIQKPGAKDKIKSIESFIKAHGTIIQSKLVLVDAWRIGQHYKEFMGKAFFPAMISYWTGSIVKVWEVELSTPLKQFRTLVGDAKPSFNTFRHSLMGDRINSIKEEFGVVDNGIHTSDSPEAGAREVELWFGTPKLASIYDVDYQVYLNRVHASLFSYLEQGASAFGAFLQFAGGTHNGLGLASAKADLDYRVLVPDTSSLEQVFNYLSSTVPCLKWDKEGTDPKTGARYIKGEVQFQNGKADVAVVPFNEYHGKIAGAHLATLMSPEFLADARARKSTALAQGKSEYKAVKAAISDEIRELVGVG